jgi:glycosyltransferase involved in cell wall biosynthesis
MTPTSEATKEAPSRPEHAFAGKVAPLRIIHVAQPTTEGVARCVGDLAARQVASGHDTTVACPPNGDLPRWTLAAGAAFEPWPATRSPGPQVMAETRRLRMLIEGVNPEVVHLHSAKAGLVGRLALRGRKATLFQPHAWSWLAASGPVRAGARNWERRAVRWSDRVICVSDEEVRLGRAAGVHARYEVVPNGIDLVRYPEASDGARAATRARLGIEEPSVVVCVGRLSRQKGQDVLLQAWPAVRRAVPDAGLYLVGDGPAREALESDLAPGVTFTGTRPDAGDWLAAADVVALPSRWEGMSIVMLEAMATGRPVVASDVAGATQALGDGAGAVVPPEDPPGLALALISRLKDPDLAREEGRRGRMRAQSHHSLDSSARAIENLYWQVLAERGGEG